MLGELCHNHAPALLSAGAHQRSAAPILIGMTDKL